MSLKAMSPAKNIHTDDDGVASVHLSVRRLVDLYDHYSTTSGLTVPHLNDQLKKARERLEHKDPDSFHLSKSKRNYWATKLTADPSYTRLMPLEVAEGLFVAFEEDFTRDGIFYDKPLVLNGLVELGPILLRTGQTNSVTEEGVQAHDAVISHFKGQKARFPVKPPRGHTREHQTLGFVDVKPDKMTIEFSIDGVSAESPPENLEIVRGSTRPMFDQLEEGDHENGASVRKCIVEVTEELTKFTVLRSLSAAPEASSILRNVVPLSIDIGPDDEVTVFVTIAEEDISPANFTSVDSDWNAQKSEIFERLYRLEDSGEKRLLAIAKAKPSQ